MKAGMIVCSGRLCPASEFGLPGIHIETRAAIVEGEAGARRDHAGAVSRVVALDQRNDIAVLIDRRHVDRLAAVRVRAPAVISEGSTLHDAFSILISPARVLARSFESICATGTGAEARVADIARHIGIGQLLRLDHDVQRRRGVVAVILAAGNSP